MAAESGRDSASLADQLYENPQAFDFLQVVRILRAMDPSGRNQLPASDPSDEFVRFSSEVSFAFPASDVVEISPANDQSLIPEVKVAFMGLGSAHSMGSLPTAYIEVLLDEPRNRDSAVRDFLDIFNHRLVSLYYGARAKHDPILQLEAGNSLFERALSALSGLGTEGLRNRVSMDDRALFARAALISMSPIPAVALTGILTSYFEVPFEIDQFIPKWFDVEEEDRTCLGLANSVLGEEVYLGDSIELCQSKFRLRVGPLSWDEYRNFFADGPSFRALLDLLSIAAPNDQDFEVQLVLSSEDTPALQLGHRPNDAARLGWSTWLGSTHTPETQTEDRRDAILTRFSLETAPSRSSDESPQLEMTQ